MIYTLNLRSTLVGFIFVALIFERLQAKYFRNDSKVSYKFHKEEEVSFMDWSKIEELFQEQ